jgi:hypothetical protein
LIVVEAVAISPISTAPVAGELLTAGKRQQQGRIHPTGPTHSLSTRRIYNASLTPAKATNRSCDLRAASFLTKEIFEVLWTEIVGFPELKAAKGIHLFTSAYHRMEANGDFPVPPSKSDQQCTS